MINCGVLFGGKSCEHDVSIITGVQLIQNADKRKYHMVPIYIARDGKWYTGEKLLDMSFMNHFVPEQVTEVYLSGTSGIGALMEAHPKKGLFGAVKAQDIPLDVVLNATHGLHGEDGTLQGLFELADLPYGCTGVMGSSVGMDKIIMKAVFRSYGFPVLDEVAVERGAWRREKEKTAEEIAQKLGFPVFVKPANLGSSIGISKAKDKEGLQEALEIAFHYDRRVLVEKGVTHLDEVNCSCLGYGENVQASVCEMPVAWEEFLGFEDKYMRGGKGGKGMQSLSRKIPAPISKEKTKEIQELSRAVFRALDCKGVVRIDYLLDKDTDTVYIGEINTQPGSFAFYLWEESGLSYSALIDRLVELAIQAYQDKQENNFAFDSEILTKVSLGGKTGGKAGSKMMGTKGAC